MDDPTMNPTTPTPTVPTEPTQPTPPPAAPTPTPTDMPATDMGDVKLPGEETPVPDTNPEPTM